MATRDYTLGRGKVLFKKQGDAAYLDLGNAPAFTVNTTIDKLEHFSSRSGLSKKDLEVITKLTMAGSFTLDEPNGPNLAMFLLSEDGAETSAQGTINTENADQIATYAINRWYPLVKTPAGTATFPATATPATANDGTANAALSGAANHATAATSVAILIASAGTTGNSRVSINGAEWGPTIARTTGGTNSVLTITADGGAAEDIIVTFDVAANLVVGDIFTFDIAYSTTPVQYSNCTAVTVATKTEGTDFVVDLPAGLIMFLTGAGGTVTPVVTATANASRTVTKGGTLSSLKGDLYFVGDPPQGRIVDVMGFCSLTPNGDWALIGEDWMQVQFNVEFLEVAGQEELIKVIDRGKAGTL